MAEQFSGYGAPAIDFSGLAQLPQIYKQGQVNARREQVLSELGKGTLDYGRAATALLAAGDTEGGLSLARLAEARSNRSEDRAFREAEAKRAQENADRAYKFQVDQAALAAKGYDYREVDDGQGGKTLVRIDKASGAVSRPSISGAPTAPPNPYATGGGMKEHESKEALFTDRAASAHETINKFENLNFGPRGTFAGYAEKVIPEAAFNLVSSNERGQLMNAKRAFVNALLRRESGAAINAGEFASYDKEYFPQPGDSVDQINSKRLHRAEVIAGLARGAGRGYQPKFQLDQATGQIAVTRPGNPALAKSQDRASTDGRPAAIAPPPEAIAELRARARSSPRALEQFDEVFGAGAAARALGVLNQ